MIVMIDMEQEDEINTSKELLLVSLIRSNIIHAIYPNRNGPTSYRVSVDRCINGMIRYAVVVVVVVVVECGGDGGGVCDSSCESQSVSVAFNECDIIIIIFTVNLIFIIICMIVVEGYRLMPYQSDAFYVYECGCGLDGASTAPIQCVV